MKTCENCGCRIYSGLCSNCHEEAYIMDVQCADLDLGFAFSPEFRDKAEAQRAEVSNQHKDNEALRAEQEALRNG